MYHKRQNSSYLSRYWCKSGCFSPLLFALIIWMMKWYQVLQNQNQRQKSKRNFGKKEKQGFWF